MLYEGEGAYGRYQVIDMIYAGRPACILYGADRQAAQSGIAWDGGDMLFDYNQRFLELVRGLKPRRLLLIGGGAFTLPQAIAKTLPTLRQDIVERDGLLLDIAVRYFDFQQAPGIRVHITDGRQFLDETRTTYDLILVDAFDNAVVPGSLQSAEAMLAMHRALRAGGTLAMNYIAAYNGARAAGLHSVIAAMRGVFSSVTLFPASNGYSVWTPQNFILTARNSERDLSTYLRYAPLALPHVGTDEVSHDGGR